MTSPILRSTIIVLAILAVSCGNEKESGQVESLSDKKDPVEERRNSIRMQQYSIKGKTLYMQECAQCHQEDGTGFAQLYPPLKDSDYLQEDVERAFCIIRNGLSEEIEVNGKTYRQAMPAHDRLTDLEIAEIMTFVYSEWGMEEQQRLYPVKEVTDLLKKCQ
ncbi:MAG: cytochrome c [Cyclobacteriaceae bacterium]